MTLSNIGSGRWREEYFEPGSQVKEDFERGKSISKAVVQSKAWTKRQDLLGPDTVKELHVEFTEPSVLEERLHIDRVWWILGWMTGFIFYEVVFREHIKVHIFVVDLDGAVQGRRYRSISGE